MLKGYTKEEFYGTANMNGISIDEIAEASGRKHHAVNAAFNVGSYSNQLFYSLVLDRLLEEKKEKGEKIYKIIEG